MNPRSLQTTTAQDTKGATRASSSLLAAALTGLLGVSAVAACSSDDKNDIEHDDHEEAGGASGSGGAGAGGTPSGSGGAAPDAGPDPSDTYNNVLSTAPLSMAEFQDICDERGGYVYVNAYCSGSAMCKGLSLHEDTLTDHSCRGINSCGGVGCVLLPEDTGLTGQEIYENGPCGNCHAAWGEVNGEYVGDYTKYTVVHGPDLTDEAALERFETSTDKRLTSIVVWGTTGFHPDGTPFYNMPTYYKDYSLAEIQRVVEYVKGLPRLVAEYEIFGTTPGLGIPDVDGGPSGSGGASSTPDGGAPDAATD